MQNGKTGAKTALKWCSVSATRRKTCAGNSAQNLKTGAETSLGRAGKTGSAQDGRRENNRGIVFAVL